MLKNAGMESKSAGAVCIVAIFIALIATKSPAADLAGVWPSNVKAARDPAELSQQLAAIENSAAKLPAPLRPAVDFQKVFVQIIASAPESAWLEDLKKLAALPGDDPVAAAIREKARIWLARANARQVDVALRKYYGDKVDFPESLDAVMKNIPEAARVDPWGKPWIYRRSKANYSKIDMQRYTLAPADYPNLAPLKKSIGDRNLPARAWKISVRPLGTAIALEFRPTATGGAAVIQPGGKVDDCTLVFTGSGWGLMAGPDQLFVVPF